MIRDPSAQTPTIANDRDKQVAAACPCLDARLAGRSVSVRRNVAMAPSRLFVVTATPRQAVSISTAAPTYQIADRRSRVRFFH
jgi:hypothetical protein